MQYNNLIARLSESLLQTAAWHNVLFLAAIPGYPVQKYLPANLFQNYLEEESKLSLVPVKP